MKDKYTNERIKLLHPKAILLFTNFINECETTFNITLRITQGLRTVEEQNKLYAQGRTTGGNIVTNAKGGYSMHNYGLAIDIAVVASDGSIDWNYNMKPLSVIAERYGITWGGNFKSIKDAPHFELNFGHGSDCHWFITARKENGWVVV